MRINFKLLSTFLAVAENASFSKAAEKLNISLSAVSMQVKQLEERLGVALFQRSGRGVTLTPEGAGLMDSTRKAMTEIDGALAKLQQAADVQVGRLSFACIPTIAGTRLPPVLVKFAKQYPGISIRVRELQQSDLLEAVKRNEVDFGIGAELEGHSELDFRRLFDDEYVALLPRSIAKDYDNGITLRELTTMPLLTFGVSHFHQKLLELLEQEELTPGLNYEFTNLSTVTEMVDAGLGVAVIPEVAIPNKPALRAVRIVQPKITRTIAIISLRGHLFSPTAGRFIHHCEAMSTPPARSGLPSQYLKDT